MEELLSKLKESKEFAEMGSNISDEQLRQFINAYQSNQRKPEGQMDEEGGIIVTPKKGFAIKTVDSKTNEKVFLNICSHELIDPPQEEEIPNIDDHIGLRVPLSLGNPKSDFDKKGGICRVYDVIVNPTVLQKAQDDAQTRQLLMELCASHIAQKHKQELSLKFRYMRLKYKGATVQQQRIRGKKQPKIEVLDKEVFETPIESVKSPEWELKVDGNNIDPETLKTAKTFELKFSLDLLVTGKAIDLKASPERISLQVGRFYAINLWMPFIMDMNSLNAEFDCQTRKLIITGNIIIEDTAVKTEKVPEEEPKVQLKPLELSSNELLYDIV
ncbi:PIH1D1 [Blepharisma stoltei]|uniref:PIH1 domain-containing protein 1 n=1 Tax=Blepharisma stoltei TaxID=1481888 RepID=A0AAU9IPH4_9CILI|nr:unnamed protein product [Blepharisma stoltei]